MWQFKYRDVEEPRFNNIGIAENLSSPITSLCVSPFPISNVSNTNTGGDNSECLVALGTYHGSLQVRQHVI